MDAKKNSSSSLANLAAVFHAFILLILSNVTISYAAPATEELREDKLIEQQNSQTGTPESTSINSLSISNKPDKNNTAIGAQAFNPNSKFQEANLNTIPEDENNLRLLEIRVGIHKLEDLIVAYQKDGMIFIPLGFFSELIDMAISTNPENGIAKGFIFKEDKQFYLDANRGEVTIAGKISRANKQQIALRKFDDIYVDSELIGKWFPMTLDIDLYASIIKLKSKEPLPFEQRLKREQRMKRLRSRLPQDRGYPKQIFPYKNWSYPLINQTAKLGVRRGANGDFDNTFSYTTYAAADLLNMESTWYLSGTDEDIVEDIRGTLSKHDPDGSLLGAARATEYAIGHINEPRLDLITRPLDSQVGALISNYPLTRQLQYDSHNFRGDLPPGWEVELYRNNELLGYINNSEIGQYQFDDIPLLFGANYFRLVFYGPQGQQREETHNFTLDHSLTEPGKHYYRAVVSDYEDFGTRTIGQYDYGVNKNLSLNINFSSIPINDSSISNKPYKTHNYISGGVRGFHKSLFYKSDLVLDMQSGSALDWEIQTRLGSFIVNLGETYFQDNFISEEFSNTAISIDRRTDLKIDTAIPASFLPRIPISFDVERKTFEDNSTSTRFGNRVSMQYQGLSLSNTLNRNVQTGTPSSTSGNFQVSRRAFGYNFRGSMGYFVSPDSELSAITFTMDGFKLWNYNIGTGISHTNRNNINEVFFNMTRSKGNYALGLNTRYSTGGIISIDLTFAMGLGMEPRTNHWITENRPIASQGAMSVQTFLDTNLNGKKDPGEKGIAGSKVQINGGNARQEADNNGILFVTGIEPYREIDVGLSVETLDDPLWQPAIKGKRISLRPGHVAQINFPIVITGEIDGTAFIQFGKEKREVSGVVVELLDLDEKVIKSAKTAYDGFYLMDKIPAGKYQLRVSREQTDSLNLLPVQPTFVVVEPDNPIVNGMDFVLQKRGQ